MRSLREERPSQSIQLLLIPEVVKSVEACNTTTEACVGVNSKGGSEDNAFMLQNVMTWLIINGMRSEALQHSALVHQSALSLYRQQAFHDILYTNACQESVRGGDEHPVFCCCFTTENETKWGQEELPLFESFTVNAKDLKMYKDESVQAYYTSGNDAYAAAIETVRSDKMLKMPQSMSSPYEFVTHVRFPIILLHTRVWEFICKSEHMGQPEKMLADVLAYVDTFQDRSTSHLASFHIKVVNVYMSM